MSWKFFVGAAILTSGLLIKAGAPLVPVIMGIAVAALLNWQRVRRATLRRHVDRDRHDG